jgi:opacity protein-like surface antigen
MKKQNFLRSVSDYRLLFALALGLLLLASSPFAAAQGKWDLTLRGGVNLPTKDLGDANLNTGFGFEGTIGYRFLPNLSAYAGWGWNRFSADRSFAGSNVDFEETGYSLGLRYLFPIADSRVSVLIGAGGIYNHIEAENREGALVSDTGHGLGWQAEAGLAVAVSERLSLIPGIRYRSLSREFKVGTTNTPVDLNYLSPGISLSWSF